MKSPAFIFFFGLVLSAGAQTPANFEYGVTLGSSSLNAGIYPFSLGNQLEELSLDISTYNGGLYIASHREGLIRGNMDGGVTLYGNPVDIVLASDDDPGSNMDRGVFNIWTRNKFWAGSPTDTPLFSVASVGQTATFDGVNVLIKNGTLTVAGSPALTQATAPAFLGSYAGAIDLGNGSTGNPAAVAIGQNSPWAGSNGSVALGGGSAMGQFSLAAGENTQAIGKYTVAIGGGARAEGWYAAAFGSSHALGGLSLAASQGGTLSSAVGSTAVSGGTTAGVNTFSAGNGTYAKAFGSVSLGSFPIYPGSSENHTQWVASDPILTVGNGFWTADGNSGRSTALQILKNGQATLKNRKWNSTAPLDDPDAADSSDADGTALIVKGHTQLEGKVTVKEPQGDISMGIYQ